MPFRKVQPPPRVRLSDAIGEQIEQLIVDGTLLPGNLLPAERELSKRLHVSRPSLREALLKLEARGLLRAGRGGSLAVTDVSAPTITDPLVHLLHRYAKAAQDVQGVRHGLEVMAAYHAAINATEADRRKLRKIFSKMPKDGSKHDALADADIDTDFHMTIAEASKNVALVHIVHGIFNLLRTSSHRADDLLYQQAGNIPILREQHAAILNAILARDPEAARSAAQLHFAFVQASLREIDRSHAAHVSKGSPRPSRRRKTEYMLPKTARRDVTKRVSRRGS
jgi:GntR family transcriptional repressor for pyruvate dehydrogenase complex